MFAVTATLRKIDTAATADTPKLVALLTVLFTQEADFQADPARLEPGPPRIIDHPESGRIFVRRDDGEILGMVSVLFRASTALGGPVGWLEDMVVDPCHRGTGVGSTLLRHAVAFAREAGLLRLTLLTDTANAGARRFYERHGFRRSAMLPMRRVS